MKWKMVLVLFAGLLLTAETYGTPLEPAEFPSLTSSLKTIDTLEFCGEQVPLEAQEIRERLEKELLLSLWDRPQVILWLKRSPRFLPHIEKMMKESGLPDDLKYVAIAESALRPHAGSKKGAIGFWQFLPDTGRMNGLIINERIDERRNVFASTRAAIKYFKELRKTFGAWTIAVAAYNMGEQGLMAEILEQETNNYYSLYLPLETQRFIFRILSVKLILSDPEKYGFKFNTEDYYPPLTFDKIQFDCFQEIPIKIIAKAAKTHFKVIKDLNPEIRGHYLSAGSHNILIPKGASEGFKDRFRKLEESFLETQKGRIYIIQSGDNLSSIADKFDVPIASLIIWNSIDLSQPIHPGDRLIIYPKNIKSDKTSTPGDSIPAP